MTMLASFDIEPPKRYQNSDHMELHPMCTLPRPLSTGRNRTDSAVSEARSSTHVSSIYSHERKDDSLHRMNLLNSTDSDGLNGGTLFEQRDMVSDKTCIPSPSGVNEEVVNFLVQRRLELRRTLGELNNELLKLLYEEWTLTGRIPEGYKELLQQMNHKTNAIKTTSFPLPRMLIRRASTLTRPKHDVLDQSTSSSVVSSIPWTNESDHLEEELRKFADSEQTEITDPQHVQLAAGQQPLTSVFTTNSPSRTEFFEDLGITTSAVLSPERSTTTVAHPNSPVPRTLCDDTDGFMGSECSEWTEDEDDLRRTVYELQLRRLEVDYAVISQLHAVHKQRAMETKRDAYRIAYKSNSRKLKEISAQMAELKAKLSEQSLPQPQTTATRGPKSTWQRRKTWNPLRLSTHQWNMATLPRRRSRCESPDIKVCVVDAFSTPVTPERGFRVPFDSPIKPPPSLASGTASCTVSRASSATSHEQSDRTPTCRTRPRRTHQRASLIPLMQIFRHAGKPKEHEPDPHCFARPQPQTMRSRGNRVSDKKRMSTRTVPKAGCDSTHSQCASVASSVNLTEDTVPDRSSLFFPKHSWKPPSICSSCDVVVPRFTSPASSLRDSLYGTLRSDTTPVEVATLPRFSQSNKTAPKLGGTPKPRRSLSNPGDGIDFVGDAFRDSAIDMRELICDSHTARSPSRRLPSMNHWHSTPDLAAINVPNQLTCHRRGRYVCAVSQRLTDWAKKRHHPAISKDSPKRSGLNLSTTRYSASSFPATARPIFLRNVSNGSSTNNELALRPAASHTSSTSNWSTSGCSCLSSQTASSTTTNEHRQSFSEKPAPTAASTQPTDVLMVPLRNLEDRGRRVHNPPSNADAYGTAIPVKCICSCFSDRDSTLLTQGSSNGGVSSIDPTPIGSMECLDRPCIHFPRRMSSFQSGSCETTVHASPARTSSSSPSCSTSGIPEEISLEKVKAKTTCGSAIEDVKLTSSTLSKGSMNRRSMRPFAFLRRAVSKAGKSHPQDIDSGTEHDGDHNKQQLGGPFILPNLVTGRQLIRTDQGQCRKANNGALVDHSVASNAPLIEPSEKTRFLWPGKLRHSARGLR